MGSLKSIVDMLPAAGPFKQIQATDVDSKELSRTEAIIGSMTAKERANDSILNGQPAAPHRGRQRDHGAAGEPGAEAVSAGLRHDAWYGSGVQAGPAPQAQKEEEEARAQASIKIAPHRAGPRPVGLGGMDIKWLLGR